MIYIVLMIYMGLAAGYAGGSLPGSKWLDREYTVFGYTINLTWLPELFLALPFGFVAAQFVDDLLIKIMVGLFATTWSFLWIQTGHGFVLGWGRPRSLTSDPKRRHTLTPVVDWLAKKIGIVKYQADQRSPTVNYCRLFMAVKGFMIGLPVGGILLAALWPLAYEIGERFRRDWLREVLSGIGAAIVVSITWTVFS
jgi:hypothetical protein